MTLDKLPRGESAVILTVEANKELKNRFNSLGLTKGETVYVEYHSLAKKTMEIRIKQTRIALRTQEAEYIEVEAS